VFDLGSGPHNLARWNPHGRFLAIAGFGNLPGDVVFYDRKADGKCKRMGAARRGSPSAPRTRVVSPRVAGACGLLARELLFEKNKKNVAPLAPRMRVARRL
jgi:Eukaryotic translation initiation factor eIF2A